VLASPSFGAVLSFSFLLSVQPVMCVLRAFQMVHGAQLVLPLALLISRTPESLASFAAFVVLYGKVHRAHVMGPKLSEPIGLHNGSHTVALQFKSEPEIMLFVRCYLLVPQTRISNLRTARLAPLSSQRDGAPFPKQCHTQVYPTFLR
jgi:hypothetical protein